MVSTASDNGSPNCNSAPRFHDSISQNQTMSTTTIMASLINILTIISFLFAAAPTLLSLQFESNFDYPCTGSPTINEPFTSTPAIDNNVYVFGVIFNEYNEINNMLDIYFNGNEIIFDSGLIPQTPTPTTITTTTAGTNIYVSANTFYAAILAAYLPIDICLIERVVGDLFGGLLSSINGLISAICGEIITIIGGYFNSFNGFFQAALSAITVITVVTRIGFDFSQQAVITQTQQRHTTAPAIDNNDKICLTGVGSRDFDFNEYVFNNEINNIFDIYFNGNEIIFNCGSLIPPTPTTITTITTTRREKNIIADAFYAAGNENKCGIPISHIPYSQPFLEYSQHSQHSQHLPDSQYLPISTTSTTLTVLTISTVLTVFAILTILTILTVSPNMQGAVDAVAQFRAKTQAKKDEQDGLILLFGGLSNTFYALKDGEDSSKYVRSMIAETVIDEGAKVEWSGMFLSVVFSVVDCFFFFLCKFFAFFFFWFSNRYKIMENF